MRISSEGFKNLTVMGMSETRRAKDGGTPGEVFVQ